jgi:hypothetical protein
MPQAFTTSQYDRGMLGQTCNMEAVGAHRACPAAQAT